MTPYKCDPCNRTYSSISTLNRHLARMHSPNPRSFKCKHCPKVYSRNDVLKAHLRTQHSGRPPHECSYCGKRCNSNYQLKQHISIHTDFKPYKCDICSKSFRYKQQFQDHKNRHDGIRPLSCHLCEKSFVCDSELKTHLNYHFGRKPYKCKVCGKKFAQHCHWRAHSRTHTGDRPFKCDLCPKAFSQSSHLQTHKTFHTGVKPYQCTDCKESFRLPHTLKSHIRRHTGEKPYKCHLCPKAFTQPSPLNHHIQSIHGNETFSCITCEKTFPSQIQLKVHSKLHFKNIRFFCTFCDKGWAKYSELDKHIRWHTKENPVVCKDCGKWHNGNHRKGLCVKDSTPPPEITCEAIPMPTSPLPTALSPPLPKLEKFNQTVSKEVQQLTPNKKTTPPATEKKSTPEKKIFQCKICHKILNHQNHLNGHMGIHKKKKRKTKKGGASKKKIQPPAKDSGDVDVPIDNSESLLSTLLDDDDMEIEYATAEDYTPVPIPIPIRIREQSRSPSPLPFTLCIESVRHVSVEELSKLNNSFRPLQCDYCNKMYKTKTDLERHMEIHGVAVVKAVVPEVEKMHNTAEEEPSRYMGHVGNGENKLLAPPEILEIFDDHEEVYVEDEDDKEEEGAEVDIEMPTLDVNQPFSSSENRRKHSSGDSLPPILFDETGTNKDPLQDDTIVQQYAPLSSSAAFMSTNSDSEDIEVIDISSPTPTSFSSSIPCDFCSRFFGNKGALAIHMKTHLREQREQHQQQQQMRQRERSLQLQEVREKKYKCILCSYVAASSSELVFHARSVHYAVHSHKCAFCWKSFSSQDKLNEHVQINHYGDSKPIEVVMINN